MSKNFVFSESGKDKVPVDIQEKPAPEQEEADLSPQEAGKREAERLIQEENKNAPQEHKRNGKKVYFCSVCKKDYVMPGPFRKHEERCKALIKTHVGTAHQADSELKGELERLKQQLQATQDRHLRMYEELAKQTTATKQAAVRKPDPAKQAEEEALKKQMIALTQTVGRLAESFREPKPAPAPVPSATQQFNQSIDKAKPPAPKPAKPLPSGSWFA